MAMCRLIETSFLEVFVKNANLMESNLNLIEVIFFENNLKETIAKFNCIFCKNRLQELSKDLFHINTFPRKRSTL